MCSTQDDAALPAPGFPIRRSTGQRLFSASPWLIAAVHVLLRLLVPRHPPHALSILTVINCSETASRFRAKPLSVFWPTVQFSRSGEKASDAAEATPGLSKLNSMQASRPLPNPVDISGRAGRARGSNGHGPSPADRGVPRPVALGLPRKEVIQPHLPVRLPCYDFTPIASPTFDGSLPCGLGHRLRVLPTFVV
jgi:hypothetical protein